MNTLLLDFCELFPPVDNITNDEKRFVNGLMGLSLVDLEDYDEVIISNTKSQDFLYVVINIIREYKNFNI